MQRIQQLAKLGAGVMVGLALATSPAWVGAADDKKSTTESMKTTVSDSWITSKTKIALMADSRVSGTAVNVETKDGMVYLRGKVESDAAKSAAAQIARGIDGARGVKNELQVVPESVKKAVEARDDDITKQVKERFKADPKLKSLDIRTDNGVVTVQGEVTSINDSLRASQTAREVPGVRAVRNDTTYDKPKASTDSDRAAAKPSVTERMSRKMDQANREAASGSQAHVRVAQEKLKEKGFDPGPIDGMWGPRTAAAVGEFQRKENLTVTSRLDADTLGKLEIGVGGATGKQKP